MLGRALSSRNDPEAARRGLIRGIAWRFRSRIGLTRRTESERLRVLRLAWRIDPGDFWVNSALAAISDRPGDKTRFYSAAVALRLRSRMAHFHLGTHFMDQREWNGAVDEFRAALRIQNFFAAHVNLSVVLCEAGRWDEAVAEGRTLVRLAPKNLLGYVNLGNALTNAGQVEEAIDVYRRGLRIKSNGPMLLAGLGVALRKHGEFGEAIAALRRARDLAKTDARFRRQVERELAETERRASLTARLPAVLAGTLKPADAAETLSFAEFCHEKKLYGASARCWALAFQLQPKLADGMQGGNRYNAACAVALAAAGQGRDDPPLDEPAKARWRKQAIDWLKADLAAWAKVLEKGPPAARQSISQTLKHWKVDPDLAGLRDPAMLAKLPIPEQAPCRESLESGRSAAGAGPGTFFEIVFGHPASASAETSVRECRGMRSPDDRAGTTPKGVSKHHATIEALKPRLTAEPGP